MKLKNTTLKRAISFALASSTTAGLLVSGAALAEETKAEEQIEKIAVVGSRSAPRSMGDSPVPLDIIGADEFKNQGATDMSAMMSAVVPSFNVNDQPINDASTLVRPINLRGLASDHTLVLVNGKRRHRSAVITFLGGGLSDGAQGPDISNIPASAIKQIEILRDGAAAQYGSDAIAGVINFVLKDAADGGSLEARYGSYYEGDGDTYQVQGNIGLPLTDNGFANFSMEYREADATSRSVQRDDAAGLIAAGNTHVPAIAQVWGTPEIKYDFKVAGNFGLDLGNDNEAYMFTNYAEREIDGGFYYRNPQTRGGVYSDGNGHLLVGDLTTDMSGNCPTDIVVSGNILNDPRYINEVANNPNCFSFNEILPGGFTPRFGGTVTDAAITMGTRGETKNQWHYDFSVTLGYSDIEYSIRNTVNPSLGPDTPFSFSPGSATQIEKNANLELSKLFDVEGWAEPVNVAFGLEYRRDSFEQQAGDPASYAVGLLAYNPATGTSQGFGIGSNGFPGIKPEAAGTWSRGNWAAYVDVETYVGENLLVGAAARYEDFTDFGSTFNGKLTSRYQLTESMALRGAVSTGFKAPTVGQSNVLNVTTAMGANGLEDQALLPPTNPIAALKGATELKPEESVSYSFGFVGDFENGLNVTLDYFNIEVTDRLSTTSSLALSQNDIDTLLAQGVRDASSYSGVKYFTNDFDTSTQGIDLVMNYSMDLFGGETKLALAYNWTDTSVDKVTKYDRGQRDANGNVVYESNLTDSRIHMLEDNLPAHRGNFSVNHTMGDFRTLARVNYYGKYYEDHLDAGVFDIYAGSKVTVDLEVSYYFDENIQLAVGAQNLFDNTPDDNPFSGVVGSQYPTTSPMGINGGMYYLRGVYTF